MKLILGYLSIVVMKGIENTMAPDVIGTEKSRYFWEATRHHVFNHLMAAICIVFFVAIYQSNGIGVSTSAWAQAGLSISVTLGSFYFIRALNDYHLRNIGYLTIIGDKGFCIYKYNMAEDEVLSQYMQSYEELEHIEKREHDDVSEDGIYLQTVAHYTFYAPDKKFHQKIVYNRNDVRLSESYGMPEVKAMLAIERAYNQSCAEADVTTIQETTEVIPSHPQGLLKIRKPIMWADVEE